MKLSKTQLTSSGKSHSCVPSVFSSPHPSWCTLSFLLLPSIVRSLRASYTCRSPCPQCVPRLPPEHSRLVCLSDPDYDGIHFRNEVSSYTGKHRCLVARILLAVQCSHNAHQLSCYKSSNVHRLIDTVSGEQQLAHARRHVPQQLLGFVQANYLEESQP